MLIVIGGGMLAVDSWEEWTYSTSNESRKRSRVEESNNNEVSVVYNSGQDSKHTTTSHIKTIREANTVHVTSKF